MSIRKSSPQAGPDRPTGSARVLATRLGSLASSHPYPFPFGNPPFAPAPAGAQTGAGCVAGTGQSGGGFTRSLLEWELTQASARRKGRQRCGTRISPIRARPIRGRARTEQYAHLVGAAYDLLRVCRSKPRWPGRDRARRRGTRIGLPIRGADPQQGGQNGWQSP